MSAWCENNKQGGALSVKIYKASKNSSREGSSSKTFVTTEKPSSEETESRSLSLTSTSCGSTPFDEDASLSESSGSGRKINLEQETEICCKQAPAVGREAPLSQDEEAAQILRALLERAREGVQGGGSVQSLPINQMGEREKGEVSHNKIGEGKNADVQVEGVTTAAQAINVDHITELARQREEDWRRLRTLATPPVAGVGRSTSTGLPETLVLAHTQPAYSSSELGPADCIRIATSAAFQVIMDKRWHNIFNMDEGPPLLTGHPMISTRRAVKFNIILSNLAPLEVFKGKGALAGLLRLPMSQVGLLGARVNTPLYQKIGRPLRPADIEVEIPEKISFEYRIKYRINWNILTSMPAYLRLNTWHEWNCMVTSVEQLETTKMQIEALGVFQGKDKVCRLDYDSIRHPCHGVVFLERPMMKQDPKVCGFNELLGLNYATEMKESHRRKGCMPKMYK